MASSKISKSELAELVATVPWPSELLAVSSTPHMTDDRALGRNFSCRIPKGWHEEETDVETHDFELHTDSSDSRESRGRISYVKVDIPDKLTNIETAEIARILERQYLFQPGEIGTLDVQEHYDVLTEDGRTCGVSRYQPHEWLGFEENICYRVFPYGTGSGDWLNITLTGWGKEREAEAQALVCELVSTLSIRDIFQPKREIELWERADNDEFEMRVIKVWERADKKMTADECFELGAAYIAPMINLRVTAGKTAMNEFVKLHGEDQLDYATLVTLDLANRIKAPEGVEVNAGPINEHDSILLNAAFAKGVFALNRYVDDYFQRVEDITVYQEDFWLEDDAFNKVFDEINDCIVQLRNDLIVTPKAFSADSPLLKKVARAVSKEKDPYVKARYIDAGNNSAPASQKKRGQSANITSEAGKAATEKSASKTASEPAKSTSKRGAGKPAPAGRAAGVAKAAPKKASPKKATPAEEAEAVRAAMDELVSKMGNSQISKATATRTALVEMLQGCEGAAKPISQCEKRYQALKQPYERLLAKRDDQNGEIKRLKSWRKHLDGRLASTGFFAIGAKLNLKDDIAKTDRQIAEHTEELNKIVADLEDERWSELGKLESKHAKLVGSYEQKLTEMAQAAGSLIGSLAAEEAQSRKGRRAAAKALEDYNELAANINRRIAKMSEGNRETILKAARDRKAELESLNLTVSAASKRKSNANKLPIYEEVTAGPSPADATTFNAAEILANYPVGAEFKYADVKALLKLESADDAKPIIEFLGKYGLAEKVETPGSQSVYPRHKVVAGPKPVPGMFGLE